MTVVNIDLAEPDGKPLTGCLDFKPTARFADGAQLRLPTPVQVRLLDGLASPDLPASEPGWVWQVTERVNGGKRRHVQIPATGPVQYTDLPDIDPRSLEPAASPDPAWVGDLAAVTDTVGAFEQTAAGLATSVATKADISTVAALTNVVAAKADASALPSKADNSTVEALSRTVASKADASAVTALAATVSTKADASTVATLTTTVGAKADKATVDGLATTVAALHTVAFDTDGTPYIVR